jgi:LysR substrate binding domain-containing protein
MPTLLVITIKATESGYLWQDSIMARHERESAFPTLWQLGALLIAAERDSWEQVTEELGVSSKHQVLRMIERLEDKLGIERGLLVDLDNKPHVDANFEPLIADVRTLMDAWRALQVQANRIESSYFVRLDGYWSHVENFAAGIVANFKSRVEHERNAVRIELISGFGSKRDLGGAGMVEGLVQRNPRVDAVIAPEDERPELKDIHGSFLVDGQSVSSKRLYRWAIVAAIDVDHPLKRVVDERRTISIAELKPYPLAVSPKGHRSRDLIDLFQSASRRFDIRFVSEEPAALIAFGDGTNVIPIIASDSTLPLVPWTRGKRKTRAEEFPDWWPAVEVPSSDPSGREVLGGAYGLYWRSEDSPRGLPKILEDLGEQFQEAAVHLEARAALWVPYLRSAFRD